MKCPYSSILSLIVDTRVEGTLINMVYYPMPAVLTSVLIKSDSRYLLSTITFLKLFDCFVYVLLSSLTKKDHATSNDLVR